MDIASERKTLTLPNDLAACKEVQEEIDAQLSIRSCHEKDLFGIRLALEEALVNAVKHGNEMDPSKKVFVEYTIADDRFEILIRDEGKGYDPEEVPDPTAVENVERSCGRGLMLMRYYMTTVDHNEKGNEVTMVKIFRIVQKIRETLDTSL